MSQEEKAEVIHKAAKHYAKQIKEAKAKKKQMGMPMKGFYSDMTAVKFKIDRKFFYKLVVSSEYL